MLAKNCTAQDLQAALEAVNRRYNDNIRFKKIEPSGRHIRFTLTVNSSKGKGARLGFPNFNGNQRHIAAACWHAHGDFFDALFQVNGEAVIVTAQGHITRTGGNWQDRNIGTDYRPLYYSEACECG